MSETPPVRTCEGCRAISSTDAPGWYVDPEGIELCPECADELAAVWRAEGFADG